MVIKWNGVINTLFILNKIEFILQSIGTFYGQ